MKNLLVSSILFLIALSSKADWNKIYGGDQNDYGNAIVSIESGYIAVGQTDSFGNAEDSKSEAWIMRLNKSGNELWSRTFGLEDKKDGFNSVIIKDNHIYAVGYSHFDMIFTKYDMNGQLLFEKIIENDIAASILDIIDDGSGFVIAGMGKPNLIKIDYEGNFIWGKKYGDKIKSILNSDDGYYIVGNVVAKIEGIGIIVPGFMFYELDKNGDIVYENPYSKSDLGIFNSIISSSDNKLILTGKIIEEIDEIDTPYSYTLCLDKETFSSVWNYKGKEFTSFTEIVGKDSSYFICGLSPGQDQYPDFNITLLNSNGNLEYEESFGDSIYDYPSDMILDVNKLIIVGQSERENSGKRYDMEIISKDIDNILSVNDNKQNFNFSINPNPITANSKIELDLEITDYLTIYISDMNGRIIHSYPRNFYQSGNTILELPFDKLNSSSYFLNVETKDKIFSRKFISVK